MGDNADKQDDLFIDRRLVHNSRVIGRLCTRC